MPGKTLRLAGVIRESITDGPGWRFVIFAQGCPHGCHGCHNPQTHDPSGGYKTTTEALLAEIRKNPLLRGVTFSGGEPFEQADTFAALARDIHALGLDIYTYTGYTFEELLASGEADKLALLRGSDVLVDGRFVLAEKTLSLPLRGSKNQRVIDVGASLADGRVVKLTF